jgi:hypothetical protein
MTKPAKSNRLIIAIYLSIAIWFVAILTLAADQLVHPTTMVWKTNAQAQEVFTFLIAAFISWLISIAAIWKQEKAGSSLLNLEGPEVLDLILFAGIGTLLMGAALSQTPWMRLYIPAGYATTIFGSIIVALAMYLRHAKAKASPMIIHRVVLVLVVAIIVYEILSPLQMHL